MLFLRGETKINLGLGELNNSRVRISDRNIMEFLEIITSCFLQSLTKATSEQSNLRLRF